MLCFYGNIYNSWWKLDFIMRILLDRKYDKYLGAFGLVLASMNNGTIRPLFVCTEANYESGLRAAATYHANEGVSVKWVWELRFPWELGFRIEINIFASWLSLKLKFHVPEWFCLYAAFSCLFDPALDFGKYSFIFTSDQLTQQKAHALLAEVLRFETQSKTQSKWV